LNANELRAQLFLVAEKLGVPTTTTSAPATDTASAKAPDSRTVAESNKAQHGDPPRSGVGGNGGNSAQGSKHDNRASEESAPAAAGEERPTRSSWEFEVETRCGDAALLDALHAPFAVGPVDDDDDNGPTEAGDVGATGRLWLDFVSSGLLKPPSKQHGCQPRGALSLAGCHDRGKSSDARPSNPTPGQQGQLPGSNAVPPATQAVLPSWRLMQAERRRRGLVVGVKPLPYPGLH